jgi:hypothetical protein
MDLTEADMPHITERARGGVKRTDAYAVLLITPHEDYLKAVLETPKGTETWTFKRRRHGDIFVIELPTRTRNADSLGVIEAQG